MPSCSQLSVCVRRSDIFVLDLMVTWEEKSCNECLGSTRGEQYAKDLASGEPSWHATQDEISEDKMVVAGDRRRTRLIVTDICRQACASHGYILGCPRVFETWFLSICASHRATIVRLV